MAVGAAAGKIQSLVQNVQKTTDNKASGTSFKNALNKVQETSKVNQSAKLQEAAKAAAPQKPGAIADSMKTFVTSMTKSNNAMDRVMQLALSKPHMNNQQLVALQALTYKATNIMQASSKLISDATNSIKSIASQQV